MRHDVKFPSNQVATVRPILLLLQAGVLPLLLICREARGRFRSVRRQRDASANQQRQQSDFRVEVRDGGRG